MNQLYSPIASDRIERRMWPVQDLLVAEPDLEPVQVVERVAGPPSISEADLLGRCEAGLAPMLLLGTVLLACLATWVLMVNALLAPFLS
ncbi:hypothetical protein [Rubellimicrobium arenae]|uniref:hypothetical protein n=1 Tax=Rubellimicrobium arenae TaxID=2817372 RepID=UPI001B30A396|nr:hypothetical protein [Rubellimicrobium arenae]